ncbi:MAG: hypothetical protein AB8I08_11725 [Sandaracinaceae bacterium]
MGIINADRRVIAACVALLCTWLGALAFAQDALDPYLGIPEGGGPVVPGQVPRGLDSIDADACGACHQRHLREWRGSAHHTAFTNPLFEAEYTPQQQAYCDRCHAPRADAEAGVDCAVCHVRGGAVLNPTVSGRAPHLSREAPELAGTLACARCHDFAFEGQEERLQRTVEEWMASPHNGTPCQGCHLRARGRHHDHTLPGGLDARLLRDAIEVQVTASRSGGQTRVRLRLAAAGAGHAVPTGDIFRRLIVEAWPRGQRPSGASTELGRRFVIDARGHHRERADDRIPAAGERVVELVLEGEHPRLGWSVWLWRTDPTRAARLSLTDAQSRRRLARGWVRSLASVPGG